MYDDPAVFHIAHEAEKYYDSFFTWTSNLPFMFSAILPRMLQLLRMSRTASTYARRYIHWSPLMQKKRLEYALDFLIRCYISLLPSASFPARAGRFRRYRYTPVGMCTRSAAFGSTSIPYGTTKFMPSSKVSFKKPFFTCH